MDKGRLIATVGIVGLAVIVAMSLPPARTEAGTGHDHHGQPDKMDIKKHLRGNTLSLDKVHSENLLMVSRSIDKAVKAIESGDSKAALAELHKARKTIASINEAIGKHVKPEFVNNRCPLMGSPIKPDKVTKNLIRDYKGQKVAFCCAGCPSKWDKLTDAEKQAKLAKVKPKPAKHHSEDEASEHHEEKGDKAEEYSGHEGTHGGEGVQGVPLGANRMCPVIPDEKVDPSFYVQYKGNRIYVCCKKCVTRVSEDPAAWYAKAYGDEHDH
jgi:hypothetical protein